MAEPTMTFVVEKLRSLLVSEGTFLAEVGDEIEWMELELRRMHCFLRDAGAKQETDHERVKEIMEAAFQVEDVVDGFVQRFGSVNRRTGFKNSVKRYVSFPMELQARRRISKEIQNIRSKIQEISETGSAYGIESCLQGGDLQGKATAPINDERLLERRRLAVHRDDAEVVVGFEKEAEKLVKLLMLGVERRRVTVSVVGRGGVGKTTLARKVFNSIDCGAFGCRVWISITRGRKAREILEEITWKAMGMSRQEMEVKFSDELEEMLRKFLGERRYLIVLDDVGSTELWYQINPHLPNASNSSRVFITTRSVDVATSALPCFPPHELQGLSDVEERWELFRRKAFLDKNEMKEACKARELVTVGKQIADGCCGLPLALVLMGGLLFGKACTPSSWMDSVVGVDWKQEMEPGKQVMDILDLSYGDLPHRLKWCFLYLSAFPEGYEINAEKLIRLWIAEGFVPKAQGESLEETGERYLEELIQRCMIRISTRNIQGDIETCNVHDLLHDLSISMSREVGFSHVHGYTDEGPHIRRLAVHGDWATQTYEIELAPSVRTLLNFSKPSTSALDLKTCRLLRVVDLEGLPIESLPKDIGEMIHLRYLCLRDTRLKRLPSSTCELYNLQTLDVRNTEVLFLPDGVWTIKTLRHVYGSWLDAPQSIGGSSQSHLQTLDAVAAGPWVENSLYRLSNLRKLLVFRFEADRSYARLLTRNVVKLQHLDTLLLSSGEGPLPIDLLSTIHTHHQLQVMSLRGSLAKCLEFEGLPPNLVKLSLKSTKLAAPFWVVVANLRLLKVLVLEKGSYVGSEMPCVAGSFPQLRELWLENLERLRRWELEKKAMPCLAYLRINACQALVELPSGMQHLRSLQRLELKGMSPSFCNDLRSKNWKKKLQHVSSVTIDGTVLK